VQEKVLELKNFRESSLFSEKERAALEYAERITDIHLQVDDKCFEAIQKYFDNAEIVSLTSIISMQNYHAKFNGALRVDSNEVCPVPLSQISSGWR
jgi:alkylhydroperoxidase family enzyme